MAALCIRAAGLRMRRTAGKPAAVACSSWAVAGAMSDVKDRIAGIAGCAMLDEYGADDFDGLQKLLANLNWRHTLRNVRLEDRWHDKELSLVLILRREGLKYFAVFEPYKCGGQ